ncbi:MAG: deoxyribodipyrimidine photo-lyase [Candidatus Omnitrophica bacterium]|nr:Deoxyribodipyrimidine photo-lyase [bacterium]NUN95414.1 deoxyribodipyrimidine photo-lyase [Candidatus Omnitrophota bacterium]
MGGKPSIVWFHQDLRLKDNPALVEAIKQGGAVIPLYIWELSEEGEWGPGGASRVWLHQSLKSLDMSLRARGSALVLRRGESIPVLRSVIRETGADAVYWNRRYEPHAIGMDQQVKTELRSNGIHAESFCASLLFEPWDVRTRQGTPFKVFTPFWKACLAAPDPPFPLSVPSTIPSLKHRPQTLSLEDLRLKPQMEWVQGILKAWDVGEEAAHNALLRFLKRGIGVYSKDRERPDRTGSSRLSPYLHHGELSPRTVWHLVSKWREMHKGGVEAAQDYLRELIWREFAYHLLFHFPETVSAPLRAEFAAFPWKQDRFGLLAWQRGKTGYPLVDAGMRELWATGWMHNRVRMVAASFLTKHLRIRWQEGARWFWDTLVDADLANNTLGWQWTAGCGADAAPFFRIFNPSSQGERFDPEGRYVRRWVPELGGLPDRWIHRPWEAPASVLNEAGVTLGKDYPFPIVDHAMARTEALEAYRELRARNTFSTGTIQS